MFVPLTTFDALFGDEPALERNELRVGALHTFGGFDEFVNWTLGSIPADDTEQLPEPARKPAWRRMFFATCMAELGEFIKDLFEFLLGVLFLHIERCADGLQAINGIAKRREIGVY